MTEKLLTGTLSLNTTNQPTLLSRPFKRMDGSRGKSTMYNAIINSCVLNSVLIHERLNSLKSNNSLKNVNS